MVKGLIAARQAGINTVVDADTLTWAIGKILADVLNSAASILFVAAVGIFNYRLFWVRLPPISSRNSLPVKCGKESRH